MNERREDGPVTAVKRLLGPDGGVEVWADPAFGWVQVFTPDDHPGRGRAVAVEPMTCPPDAFRSGRDFAAWIGLTPKDHSTAGKKRLGGITRAGDEMLRSVLVVGATAVIQQVVRGRRQPSPWLAELLKRKPRKLAAVALGIALARTSGVPALERVTAGYIALFQGTPLLMQLFVVYYGVALLGVDVNAWIAVAIAFTLHASAFLGEIWRGSIQDEDGNWHPCRWGTYGACLTSTYRGDDLNVASRVAPSTDPGSSAASCSHHEPVDTGMRTSWCKTPGCTVNFDLVDGTWRKRC